MKPTKNERICGTCSWCSGGHDDEIGLCYVNPPILSPTTGTWIRPEVHLIRACCRHWTPRKAQQQASEPWDNEPPTPDAELPTRGWLIRQRMYDLIVMLNELPASEARSIVQAYASDLMNRLQDIP